MKRRINSERIKECVSKLGDNALAKASVASGVSVSTIQQMMAGTYSSQPTEENRFKLIRAFGVEMEDLFPFEDSEAS